MNERIKELIKQATTIEEHKWGVSYDNFDKEKFAELIVRDIHAYVDSMDTAQVISNGILKRYGVNL